MIDQESYRQRSYEIWEKMAPGWYRERDFVWAVSQRVGEQMVDALDPQPGQRILEVAAGVGDTGFRAATRVGVKGGVISTDFAPKMVDAARERGSELGLENVEYRVMDAERMDLPTDSVDGVLCRWGYMLMADPEQALRETRRVLRGGGRLSFAVWGDAARNQWAALTGALLVESGHMEMPEPGTPGIFALADPDRIRELLGEAGFAEPRIEEIEVSWAFNDFDQYWMLVTELAGATAMVIESLSASEVQSVRQELERRVAPFASGEGYEMPGMVLTVLTE